MLPSGRFLFRQLLFVLLQMVTASQQDIQVSPGTLVSRDHRAGCSEHRTIVCEPGAVAPTLPHDNDVTFPWGTTQLKDNNICPSISNQSCWNGGSPPPLQYQLLHRQGSTEWSLSVAWKTPPSNGGCNVERYRVMVYQSSDSEISLSCQNMTKKGTYYLGPFSNTTNHFYFTRNFKPQDSNPYYHIKIIGSPYFEYPLLIVKTPNSCNQDHFTGCQNCADGSCNPKTAPPNVTVTNSLLPEGIEVFIELNSVYRQEYFLHTLSSGKKMLHKLSEDTRNVSLTGVPYNTETLIWLEQFSCGCSNSTPEYSINVTSSVNDSVSIPQMTSSSSSSSSVTISSSSTITERSSSIESSLSFSSSNAMASSVTTHVSSSSSLSNNNIATITTSPVSSSLTSFKNSPLPTTNSSSSTDGDSNTILIATVLPIALLIVTSVLIIVTLVSFLLYRRRKCSDKIDSDVPPDFPLPDGPTTAINMIPNKFPSPINAISSPLASVIAVIPHDTCSDDKEAYLAFLYNLVQQGAELEVYCRSKRLTPADWLQSVYNKDSIVLIIVNEQFHREWEGKYVADVPTIFALKQLVQSLVQQSLDLKNFALVLPTPSDKGYIPDNYLFHTLQRFDLQDTEGMARYIFKVPEFTVDSTC